MFDFLDHHHHNLTQSLKRRIKTIVLGSDPNIEGPTQQIRRMYMVQGDNCFSFIHIFIFIFIFSFLAIDDTIKPHPPGAPS